MQLILCLQNGMTSEIKDGNIIIKISEECKRDLWKGQITFYFENGNVKDSGNIRISHQDKIKMKKH